MSRIQDLNRQRARALSILIEAVRKDDNSEIDRALLFYRLPCYSSTDTGKSDSDIKYDIRRVQSMIDERKRSVMGDALMKSGKHYLYKVVKELENVIYLRDHYRRGLIPVEFAYTAHSTECVIESQPVGVSHAAHLN